MARRDELLQRALLETSLKTDPQAGALRGILQDLAGQYTRGRRVQASNAAGIVAATQQARPDVSSAFDQALASGTAQRAALGVSGAGPPGQAFGRRVGEQRANALVDLSQRALRAEEGKVFGNNAAREGYLADKSKVQGQLVELLGQAGAMTAATLGTLEDKRADRGDKQADRRLRSGSLRETQRHNQAAEGIATENAATARQRAAQTAKDKARGKFKLATPVAHAQARDGISAAVALVKQQQQHGMKSRAEIIQVLSTGRAASKVKVDGQDVTVPAIPKLAPDWVRAATNLVFDGTLSSGDVQRLHNRRLKVKALGYPTRSKAPRAGGLSGIAGISGAASPSASR